MTGINNKAFYGKAGNQLRKRRPMNFPIISADNKVLVTIQNKHTLQFIEPEVPIEPELLNLISLATVSGIPSFRFMGDDMKATTSFVIAYDEYEKIDGMFEDIRDKIYIDWEDEYREWKTNKDLAVYRNYTREDLEAHTVPELDSIIAKIENITGNDIVVSEPRNKPDFVNALVNYFLID